MKQKLINQFLKLITYFKNLINDKKVIIIYENFNWSIKDDVNEITYHLKNNDLEKSPFSFGIFNKTVHLASFNLAFRKNKLNLPHSSNKIIITIFHLTEYNPQYKYIPILDKKIFLWHTSCNITKHQLIKFGATPKKIKLIPLGVNLNKFYPIKTSNWLRDKYSIDSKTIIIGSFQKDGIGWNLGNIPKSEKGPELLCDLLISLSKKIKIFVLLSGPARGYVKDRLKKNNIDFHHEYFKNTESLNNFYDVIDFYFITSKVEGGPKQLLESFATKTPVFSTRVGMANDIVIDSINGFIIENKLIKINIDEVVNKMKNNKLIKSVTNNAYNQVNEFEWKKIAKKYLKEIYDQNHL